MYTRTGKEKTTTKSHYVLNIKINVRILPCNSQLQVTVGLKCKTKGLLTFSEVPLCSAMLMANLH